MNKNQNLRMVLAILFFAINMFTNSISFCISPQKDSDEKNVEHIQKKINQLNEEKAKEEASRFNKIYAPYKLLGDEPQFIKDSIISTILAFTLPYLLNKLTPEPKEPTLQIVKNVILACSCLALQLGLGTGAQQHKIRTKVRKEQTKILEEVLAEMKKKSY